MKVYTVRQRCFGEVRDIREFVQPGSLPARELAAELERPTLEETIVACWDWVAKNIAYPPRPLEKMDRRYCEAFLSAGIMPTDRASGTPSGTTGPSRRRPWPWAWGTATT